MSFSTDFHRGPKKHASKETLPQISKVEVDLAIEEMETLKQDYTGGDHITDFVYPRLARMEKTLLSWLTDLVYQEVAGRFAPTESEMEWVKLIHKFYRAYVRFLRVFLAEFQLPEPCRVYIAHHGSDKEKYANHIKIYLEEKRIPGVFFDKNMLVGGCPSKQMLARAVTCNVFWFVASIRIITSTWTMRELMIAYARHQMETPDTMCLLMDCYESEPGAFGQWFQLLFGIKSLALYNRAGDKVPFPANMIQMKPNEASPNPPRHRIERLAGKKLLPGQSIIDFAEDNVNSVGNNGRSDSSSGSNSSSSGSNNFASDSDNSADNNGRGGSTMYEEFPESFRCRLSKAKEIKIITTWLNLSRFQKELIDAVANGASLHAWLLSPDSTICEYRRKALRAHSVKGVLPDPVITGIKMAVEALEAIEESAKLHPSSMVRPVDIRFWDSLPSIPIIQADDWMLHSWYLHNRTINPGPWVEVPPGDIFADILLDEIKLMDKLSKPLPPSEGDSGPL